MPGSLPFRPVPRGPRPARAPVPARPGQGMAGDFLAQRITGAHVMRKPAGGQVGGVTAHGVEVRHLRAAAVHHVRAAGVERAAGGQADEAGRLPGDGAEPLPVPAVGRQRLQQALGVRVVVGEEDRPPVRALHNGAGVHHDDLIGQVRDDSEVVGDHDDGGAELVLQGLHDLQHLGLHGDVERRGGLVRDEQLGIQRHRHRDHRALPHTAGELVREVIHPPIRLRDAYQPEQIHGPGPGLGLRHGVVVQPDHLHDLPADLVERVQAGQRVLEDHPDLRAADLVKLLAGHGQQVFALEQGGAADPGATCETHDRLGGHALARAGFADDAEGLPGIDIERHTPDGLHDAVRGTE